MTRTRHPSLSSRSGGTPPPTRRRRLAAWIVPGALIASLCLAQPAFASTADDSPSTTAATATPTATATTTTPTTTSATATPTAAPTSKTPAGSVSRAKIASIALSQVGVGDSPVATSFSGLNCNPYTTMVAGFSANSNGCGYDSTFKVRNSNENWCSDFVKWVWQQAGVTQDMNTINAAASSFYQWGLDDGQTLKADSGTPQVGDAVVFFGSGTITATRYAQHVGLIVAVNADGTVDMVNGDFLAKTNVHVEHDTNLNLTTFAANTWGAGEQWVLVSPPTATQKPNPRASISGASTAVTGTDATFRARASERHGSITGYYWTFGDGRTTNATGAEVTHVFSTPGVYTITVTATSNVGTISTVRENVTVLAASASTAIAPSTEVWYSSYPVSQYRFVRAGGSLAADVWDGASWLQVEAAGTPSATGSITALSYQDADADSAMIPHAYYRDADGSLAETSLISGTWTTATLPGHPAAGSDVVAAATASGPAVFFVDARGHLNETSLASGTWSTHSLSAFPVKRAPLALAETANGPRIFAVGPAGLLTVTTQSSRSWRTAPLPARARAGASLTAVTTPNGQASLIVNGASAVRVRGSFVQLTERTSSRRGHGFGISQWTASALPGRPSHGSAVAAADYLLPSAVSGGLGAFVQPPGTLTASGPKQPLGTAIAYLSSHGTPAVTYNDGTGWHTAALPGKATSLDGISANPVAHQPIQVYLGTSDGPVMDTTGDTAPPSGPWTTAPLPAKPATFADRVLLYGATAQDKAAADAAASVAGLPAAQVTSSFAVAWAAGISGNYLVITSGAAATTALYYNVCGWTDPSAEDGGSTPYGYVTAPRTTLPGADLFLNGSAATAAEGPQRVADLTYYALHGTLPAGQTSVPAAGRAVYTCAGSPS